MSETRQLATLVIIALIVTAGITLIALALPGLVEGNLVVDHYDAVLYENGTLTERYDFLVKESGQYRMLYRYWQDPLYTSPSAVPSIEFLWLSNPAGTTGYVKDANRRVSIVGSDGDPSLVSKIQQLAEPSEIGIFDPSYYSAGVYTLDSAVMLHPPLEYDSSYAHLNLRLVDKHIPYRNIRIVIPSQYVREVFPHPSHLSVERAGDQIIITGSAAADETVGVELLLSPDAVSRMSGFPVYVEGVAAKTRNANPWYEGIPFVVANGVMYFGMLILLATPFIFIAMYYRYGREKPFTVPKYLSFVPYPAMKPWVVNQLFKGDATNYDEDGYYATLLDLHRRGFIRITEKPDGKGVTIAVLGKKPDDPYEQRVMEFLKDIGHEDVVDTEILKGLAAKAKTSTATQATVLHYQRELSDVTRRSDPTLVSGYIVDGRDHIIPLGLGSVVFLAISIMLLIVYPVLVPILLPATFFWGGVLFQAGIAFAFPSTLFGHWKDDKYKEKLEWDAFAYFLSDLALIRQYSPSDLSQWGDWLVFGTALGVGKKVEEAMKELNIKIPEAFSPSLGLVQGAFIPIATFSPPSQGGSGGFGGGGSFGGGGGFGGGGVGGR